MAQKFRSKPVEIEAVQYTGENVSELAEWTGAMFSLIADEDQEDGIVAEVYDRLHNTWVGVSMNDWIIRGTQGEFYPCNPGVFEQKYEAVG